jgi:hypothetical protein
MRILLLFMFLAPIVLSFAIFSGVERVTPILLAMSAVALVAQLMAERRKRSA